MDFGHGAEAEVAFGQVLLRPRFVGGGERARHPTLQRLFIEAVATCHHGAGG